MYGFGKILEKYLVLYSIYVSFSLLKSPLGGFCNRLISFILSILFYLLSASLFLN
jgi:hypothetical protein